MHEPCPVVKDLEDIAWHFVAERISHLGGIILQKELYEKIYDDNLFEEDFKKEDLYIEFGQTFETISWTNNIRTNFDIDVLLGDALDILEKFNDALFEPIGSELFENARIIIKNTILSDIVTKIETIPGDSPKIVTLKFYSPEEDIPAIKNFLRTL
jgi:hypothetical protein